MFGIDPKYLQNDERIEFTDKPSMASFGCIFSYLWALIMLLPAIMVLVISLRPDSDTTMAVMSVMYLILAFPAVHLIVTTLATRYAITNKGIVTRTGIFVTNIKTVNYKHITSVSLKENIFGRLLRYANLFIDTSGSGSSIELKWRNVKSADKVKRLIDTYISKEDKMD